MNKAAGILFVSDKGNALFLKRGPTAPDCAGCWDFPGGGRENDETAEECAVRETIEEVGSLPDGVRVFHTRQSFSSAPVVGVAGVGAPPVPVSDGAPAAPPPIEAAPVAAGPVDVDFTTFLQRVGEEFVPTLNDEHVGYAWVPVDSPPEPVHPGCRIALSRLSMDELGVARAIASGQLTSPQRYENMTLWAIRITGTEAAFRLKHNEFVFRRPEDYLNPEFLARCNGLPVLFRHPKTVILNSKEFSNKVVGTIFLPYIAGNEVWGIAKIFDDEANAAMGTMSTSPGVNFEDFSVNAKLTLEDGSKVLVEGKPSLFDHVAICDLGVWDKGDEPSGIRSESRGDSAMNDKTDDKAKDDAADTAKDDAMKRDDAHRDDAKRDDTAKDDGKKADADAGTELDKKLTGIADTVGKLADAVGGLHKRMDSIEDIEKKKDDAMKADAAKKDDEGGKEKTEDKEKADAKKKADAEEAKEKETAKADSNDRAAMSKRLDEIARQIPKDMNDADYSAITDAQARADDVFSVFGKSAPRPLQGETPQLYDRRVTRLLKEHSHTWKGVDLNSKAFGDDAAFAIVRDQVFAEAKMAGMSPSTVPGGELRMITKRQGGHEIHEFVGEPRSWMDPISGPVRQYVTNINTPRH